MEAAAPLGAANVEDWLASLLISSCDLLFCLLRFGPRERRLDRVEVTLEKNRQRWNVSESVNS